MLPDFVRRAQHETQNSKYRQAEQEGNQQYAGLPQALQKGLTGAGGFQMLLLKESCYRLGGVGRERIFFPIPIN
jgi:hypothetical protein